MGSLEFTKWQKNLRKRWYFLFPHKLPSPLLHSDMAINGVPLNTFVWLPHNPPAPLLNDAIQASVCVCVSAAPNKSRRNCQRTLTSGVNLANSPAANLREHPSSGCSLYVLHLSRCRTSQGNLALFSRGLGEETFRGFSCILELGEFAGLSVTFLSLGGLCSSTQLFTKRCPSSAAEQLLVKQTTSDSRLGDEAVKQSGDQLLTKLFILTMKKEAEVKKAARGHSNLSPAAVDKVVLLAHLTISINRCDCDA